MPRKKTFFLSIVEAQPIFGKANVNASRAENKTKNKVFWFLSQGAAYLRCRQR